jgi:hypothetical protein
MSAKAARGKIPLERDVSGEGGEEAGPRNIYVLGPVGPSEHQTLEEWNELRNEDYEELTRYNIPANVIEAVRGFIPQAAVRWTNEKGDPATPGDAGLRVSVEQPKKQTKEQFGQFLADARREFRELSEPALPATAGDTLAICLQTQLLRYRKAGSAARSKKLLPPMTIARLAIDMLETHVLFDHAPGYALVDLIRSLLDADKKKLKSSKAYPPRYQAAWILAQVPDISTRELARMLGVSPISVSRWRNREDFKRLVEEKNLSIQGLEERGLWPPKESAAEKTKLSQIGQKLAEFRDNLAGLEAAIAKSDRKQAKKAVPILNRLKQVIGLIERKRSDIFGGD